MRLAILTVIATGCGSQASAPVMPPPAAPIHAAARWGPAAPSYVFASPALGDAQRGLRDALDVVAALVGVDPGAPARAVATFVGVDALHADALAAIGVDLRGSWAVFSDDLNP